jgi:hypothetical protein
MSIRRRFAVVALFSSFAWVSGAGCGASADKANDGVGPSAGTSSSSGGSAGSDSTIVDPGGTSSGPGPGQLNALCGSGGSAGECVPDDPLACIGYEPPEMPGGAGAAGGGAGNAGEAGAAGATSGGAAGNGGENTGGAAQAGESHGGAGGESPSAAAGAGGEGGDGSVTPPAAYSCQVSRLNNQPLRSCVPAGTGVANAPCFTAADCASGLACVTEGEAGRCLPYCCAQNARCDSGSYCTDRPLRKAPSDTSDAEPPRVPVCVPADGCSLEERYPCEGTDCRCKGDAACMVVRDDGTTTCQVPGAGKQGDTCPCAWNHVCSKLTNQCVQICRTDATTNECGQQKCQASSELPKNFGLCVGPTK